MPKEVLCAAIGGWLLFFCQPITGRLLTPAIGGSPSGWLFVMLWFQMSLLLGNLVALALRKTSANTQNAILALLALVGTGLLTQVFAQPKIPEIPNPENNPLQIVKFLWDSIGVQAIILGTVCATMAKSARSNNQSAKNVILASNIGAFLGLGSSLAAEIRLDLQAAQILAGIGWIVLIISALWTISKKLPQTQIVEKTSTPQISEKVEVLKITLLAALGTSLLATSTEAFCRDIGSTAIGWIPPLAAFLASYILAFSPTRKYTKWGIESAKWSLIGLVAILVQSPSPFIIVLIPLLIFCPLWAIHKKIAQCQPQNPQSQATFTTAISLGGILGSLVWAIGAPNIFNNNNDLLIVAILCSFALQFKDPTQNKLAKNIWVTTFLTGCYLAALITIQNPNWISFTILLGSLVITAILQPQYLWAGAAILFIGNQVLGVKPLEEKRNLLGAIQIVEICDPETPENKKRKLMHGSTLHGMQALTPMGWDKNPSTYYKASGPLGDILNKPTRKKILVVGLGIGTIAGYNQDTTFIEIDPHIISVAQTHFGFLTPETKILQGDGRQIATTLKETYDVVVLDAFSSDSIPGHLLTTEALEIYTGRLRKDGQILVHISNRFYDLKPLLAKNAETLGLHAFSKRTNKNELESSEWVCIQKENKPPEPSWEKIPPAKNPFKDYSGSLLQYLRL